MKNLRILTALAALFLAVTLACHAQPTASVDRVPAEDWSYNAMAHLAAKGLLPGMAAQRFEGDWLYSREQMAGFVRQALAAGQTLKEEDAAVLARLTAEFAPELLAIGTDPKLIASINPYAKRKTLTPAGSFESRIVLSGGDANLIGIYDASGIGAAGRYVTAVATVSDRRRKFDGDEFPRLQNLFVRGKTPNWEWEIGRDFLWWGPGYSGSMILSNNSPGFDMIKLGKDFDFGRLLGHIKITQFGTSFVDNDQRTYLFGRRFEKRFSKYFNVGISETAKMSERPNALIFILPAFYLYEHIYLDSLDQRFNDLVSIDLQYRFSPRFEAYVDYLVDDMTAPQFLLDQPAWDLPRKTGYLVGGHWPNVLGDGSTGLRAEYINVDVGTYQATRPNLPELAYTHDGLVIGHPVGSNSEAIYLRLDRKLAKRWTGVAEYLGRRPKDDGGPNPDNTRRINLLLVRDVTSKVSITARYQSLKLPEKENRLEVGAAYAF